MNSAYNEQKIYKLVYISNHILFNTNVLIVEVFRCLCLVCQQLLLLTTVTKPNT